MNIVLLSTNMADIVADNLIYILSGLILVALAVIVVLLFIAFRLRRKHAAEDLRSNKSADVKTAFIRHIGQAMRLSITTINEHCRALEDTSASHPLSESERDSLIQDIQSNNRLLNTYLHELQELTGFNGSIPLITMIEVNLAELIASYRREIQHEVSRGVTVGVRTNMSPHCKAILDTPMFRQLMIHLLRICALRTKEGSISIAYEWQNEGLHFLIEDTGGGIPEEYKGVMFTDMMPDIHLLPHQWRLIAVNAHICQNIVDSMKGTITDHPSEEDKGIILDFWIPCYVRFD